MTAKECNLCEGLTFFSNAQVPTPRSWDTPCPPSSCFNSEMHIFGDMQTQSMPAKCFQKQNRATAFSIYLSPVNLRSCFCWSMARLRSCSRSEQSFPQVSTPCDVALPASRHVLCIFVAVLRFHAEHLNKENRQRRPLKYCRKPRQQFLQWLPNDPDEQCVQSLRHYRGSCSCRVAPTPPCPPGHLTPLTAAPQGRVPRTTVRWVFRPHPVYLQSHPML